MLIHEKDKLRKIEEYHQIESKLTELEDLQNLLIKENQGLKIQAYEYSQKPKQVEIPPDEKMVIVY